jgi:hypothetical protein
MLSIPRYASVRRERLVKEDRAYADLLIDEFLK